MAKETEPKRDTSLNVLQRLALVQSEVSYIQKESGGDLRYAIVTHDSVTAKVRPSMVANGVLYYPVKTTVIGQNQVHSKTKYGERIEHRCEIHMVLRFANIDDREDFINVEVVGHGVDTGDKGPGKAISYAVKMGLLKALGLETGESEESERDQEERQLKSNEETAVGKYEDAIAMAVSSDELRKVAEEHRDPMNAARKDRKTKAAAAIADNEWRKRMAQLKKAEAEAPAEEEEEEPEQTGDALPDKPRERPKGGPLPGVDYTGTKGRRRAPAEAE